MPVNDDTPTRRQAPPMLEAVLQSIDGHAAVRPVRGRCGEIAAVRFGTPTVRVSLIDYVDVLRLAFADALAQLDAIAAQQGTEDDG